MQPMTKLGCYFFPFPFLSFFSDELRLRALLCSLAGEWGLELPEKSHGTATSGDLRLFV